MKRNVWIALIWGLAIGVWLGFFVGMHFERNQHRSEEDELGFREKISKTDTVEDIDKELASVDKELNMDEAQIKTEIMEMLEARKEMLKAKQEFLKAKRRSLLEKK